MNTNQANLVAATFLNEAKDILLKEFQRYSQLNLEVMMKGRGVEVGHINKSMVETALRVQLIDFVTINKRVLKRWETVNKKS